MPKDFTDCVSGGGRVRTIKPEGKDRPAYRPICFDQSGSHAGEQKTAKKRPPYNQK